MRMAKLQKATLDPAKISGHCGRLKCCLRYEDENYLELKRKLPNRNATVQTPKGIGKVVDVQVLTQLVVVQTESGDRHAWPLDEIQKVSADGSVKRKDESEKNQTGQEDASASVSPQEDAVVTEELVEMAESEQEMLEVPPHEQPRAGNSDTSSQQPQTPDASGQEGMRKKKRRRRPKNKNRGPRDGSSGQNSQNNQDNKPRPSNENASTSGGE